VTWWEWVLIWVLLAIGTGWVLFRLGRSLWRKSMALLTEFGTAAERLSVLSEELETLSRTTNLPPDLAVFDSPSRLRQERAAGPGKRARHRAPAKPSTPRTGSAAAAER
jgi:hypothetical protein